MAGVSCIICAYNEEPRIGRVLKVAVGHPLVNEVIVVDDGSTDNTAKEVLKFKTVKLVRHKKNKGKALSMFDGVKKAKNELVMFIDADLFGLKEENITELIKPVQKCLVDMTLSMRNNSLSIYKLLGIDFVSGERVIKRSIARKVLKNVTGYAIEAKINKHILDNKLKFVVVKWPNVGQTTKQMKEGFIKGWFHDFAMFSQIFKAIPFFSVIKQLLVMSFLSAKYKKEILSKTLQ